MKKSKTSKRTAGQRLRAASGSASALANRITHELMTMKDGRDNDLETADRLALMKKQRDGSENQLGGMCEKCVQQIVYGQLKAAGL